MKSTKTVLTTLLMVGVVAALLGGATYAVFSDTETSTCNEMVAGTIDFSVGAVGATGENPWTDVTWSNTLNDLKPCAVRYASFDITNVGTNPVNLWKKIDITAMNDGLLHYEGIASSEPEFVEGSGTFTNEGIPIAESYTAKNTISPEILYDMTVIGGSLNRELINEVEGFTMKTVDGFFIYLGELAVGETMTVTQSYHLHADAGNEFHGDVLRFDVTLYGVQVEGASAGPTNVLAGYLYPYVNPT